MKVTPSQRSNHYEIREGFASQVDPFGAASWKGTASISDKMGDRGVATSNGLAARLSV